MDIGQAQETVRKQGKELFGICPYVTTQTVLQGKWAIIILYQLSGGPLRFNELMRRIEIAQGTLSNQLKYLEKEGMISRHVSTEGTLRVEYELTPIGRRFKRVLDAIEEWGDEYIDYLRDARGEDRAPALRG
ncbi:MAG: helix-turn-helix transcriptional regulator [Olsenella sp.]|jgi:DNA-binding HxlR family transcriptional regulator|nr:helix-turn-helix transcriptional regulator [Olsenella sp.]MCI1289047.1 helix-turn-helix transcriptional regulator [Olsenella sp.]